MDAVSKYASWIVKQRIYVIAFTLIETAILIFYCASLKIVIDPASLAPKNHPYVIGTTKIEKVFGSKCLVLIGVTPRQGDIFQPDVLQAVERITRKLGEVSGVVGTSVLSLSAPKAKAIIGADGSFEVRPLLGRSSGSLVLSEVEKDALQRALENNPVYLDTIVSADYHSAAILAEIRERSDGFEHIGGANSRDRRG